ncbi:COG2426 family protein [Butyrivibrio sp. MC2013]|uniref:COG2426 family protein n=1 Tax=Butyrivibrio sp. MC2013 TaxID=1280686 RepID=UPI0004042FEB|nr:small multi-drug export protein [Butyrivibrio sp. MC2013]
MISKYLYVFLISMVPIAELRVAIPIAQGFKVADPAFNMTVAYIICVIGNMIPVPFIFFFARRILEWGADKPVIGRFFSFCLEKGHKGGETLKNKAGRGLYYALWLFVGIPVPGTGAWTGTLAASFLDMDFKRSVRSVMLGVLTAGIIMAVGSFIIASGFTAITG